MEEELQPRKRRTIRVNDLPTRLATVHKGENFYQECIKNVFDRVVFYSEVMKRADFVPAPESVDDIPCSIIAENLKKKGITQLLPVQRYTIPLLTQFNVDVFAEAATGNGKTLAFLLPIAIQLLGMPLRTNVEKKNKPLALIIANTQLLQLQTYDTAKSLLANSGLKVALCVGNTHMYEFINAVNSGVDIIIATTGRLLKILEREDQLINLESLLYYIYDEGDKMAAAGAFKEEVIKIREKIPQSQLPNVRNAFFSATFNGLPEFHGLYRDTNYCIVEVPSNPLIQHRIIPLEDYSFKNRLHLLINILTRDLHEQGRKRFEKTDQPVKDYESKVIIFVEKRTHCNLVTEYLKSNGFSVGIVNSDKTLQERTTMVSEFTEGKMHAVVATDSFARGHDVPNVKHVINFELKNEIATFKHRAGRTARLGTKGVCTTFIDVKALGLITKKEFQTISPHILKMKNDMNRCEFGMDLAIYLLISCGQRIPKCLQYPAIRALRQRHQMVLPYPDEVAHEKAMRTTNNHIREEKNGLESTAPPPSTSVFTAVDEYGDPLFEAEDDAEDDSDDGGVPVDEYMGIADDEEEESPDSDDEIPTMDKEFNKSAYYAQSETSTSHENAVRGKTNRRQNKPPLDSDDDESEEEEEEEWVST